MSNNGSNGAGDFDQSVIFYPDHVSPDFGRQFDGTVFAVVHGGFLVETLKYAFFLPEDEAEAAGLTLRIGDSLVLFSTLFDERSGLWLATCHPLVLDERDLAFVQKAVESGEWIEVKVSGQNARGLRLVCGTVGGFMFFSNVDWGKHRQNGNQLNLLGQTIFVRITSCTDFRGLPCFYASERDEEAVFDWSDNLIEMPDSFPVQVGQIVEGTVTGLKSYGVFVNLGNVDGLISIGEIAHRFVEDVEREFTIGQSVKVKVLDVQWSEEKSKWHIALSRKALLPASIVVESFDEPFEFDELDE